MDRTSSPTPQRTEALNKQRVVEAAIAILDAQGERALTFRALAAILSTGSGAIYWHIQDKDTLLAVAADHVIGQAIDAAGTPSDPGEAIRSIALAMFDTFDAHPWIGARLSLDPTQPATLRFFEGIGGRLQALGVPPEAQFDAWSACVNYIMGVAAQSAANARHASAKEARTALLTIVASEWKQLDAETYPFLRTIATDIPGHDDRAQFIAGINLILAGVGSEP